MIDLRIQRGALFALWLGGLLLAMPTSAEAQALDEGKKALAAQNYERALETLQQGLDEAQAQEDTRLQAAFRFNLGLTWHHWGQERLQAGDERGGRDRLRRAEALYKSVLEINPTSSGTYNNLARLYEQTGRLEEAEAAFRRAIAQGGSKRTALTLNYADFLQRQGRPQEAIRHYQHALEAQPRNPHAHEGLVDAYLAANLEDRSGLIIHLWDLLNSGREIRALETALHVLDTAAWAGNDRRIARQKQDLLTCVAVGLSKSSYDADVFPTSERARLLRSLAERDEHVGPGAEELLRLHRVEAIQEAVRAIDAARESGGAPDQVFPWWARTAQIDRNPERGSIMPYEGFRMLARALGAWHQQRRERAHAEAYYLFSTGFTDAEADPGAILKLAEMYLLEGAPKRVEQLLDKYAPGLFVDKGQAYSAEKWDKIYTYHRTLGVMYAFIGAWGDSNTATSAIFQLENARIAAAHYNEEISGDGRAQRITVEPQMIDFLARGYESTDDDRAAIRVRLEAAQEYDEQKDEQSKEYVLKPLENKILPADLQIRYDNLRTRGTLDQRQRDPQDLRQVPQRDQTETDLLTITGTVTHARGSPFSGVPITIKGTQVVTRTQRDGTYTLRARSGDVLIFSPERFRPREITVRRQTVVNVSF